jgi:hypothetical protein
MKRWIPKLMKDSFEDNHGMDWDDILNEDQCYREKKKLPSGLSGKARL